MQDRASSEKLTKAAALFCILGLSGAIFPLLANPPTDSVVGGEMVAGAEPLWFHLYNAVLVIGYGLLIFSQIQKVFALVKANPLYPLLLLYILASSLWALGPYESFVAATKIIIAVLFGFFLAARFSPKEILSLLAITMMIVIISSFLFALFLPTSGLHTTGEWRGAFLHKNGLAIRMNIAFAIFVLAAMHSKKYKWVHISFAVLSVVLIVLSQSGTGLIVLLLVAASPLFLPLLRQNALLAISYVLTLLCLGGLIYILCEGVPLIDIVFKALGKDTTLTGRMDTWEGILYSITDYRSGHSIEGYGAQAVALTSHGQIITASDAQDTAWSTTDTQLSTGTGVNVMTLDSVYMNVLVKYGLLGSLLFALNLGQGIRISIKQLNSGATCLHQLYIVIMLVLLINGISECTDQVALLWVLFTMIFASPYTEHADTAKAELQYA